MALLRGGPQWRSCLAAAQQHAAVSTSAARVGMLVSSLAGLLGHGATLLQGRLNSVSPCAVTATAAERLVVGGRLCSTNQHPPLALQSPVSCLQAAGGRSDFQDIQDPAKTHPAYSNEPGGREVRHAGLCFCERPAGLLPAAPLPPALLPGHLPGAAPCPCRCQAPRLRAWRRR